ncbi:NADH-quinone oxidoreductase subunit NuoE [Actinomyces minihominis]|uniref:NADH-quinone oxidoreductase subunit NuoE n=1 Tax=Actinomyces minihominis TaxID=2002838 RepID=UPI000C06AD58|nr:NADH-quinone oxidoreductase subunit NuoE [Actinomyces minihominis]
MTYSPETKAKLVADAQEIIARYPEGHARSALLPMLHLVQSEDGFVSADGISLCAELLGMTQPQVSAVATFYTQYKRHPNGDYNVGVCTNALCGVLGGEQIFDELSEALEVGHDETTPDGKITLERIECNAACDFAPVIMVNWEFFDNQTPESALKLVDDLKDGTPVHPTRGPNVMRTFKENERTLAGFRDGLANQGPSAGVPTVHGLEIAKEHDWVAPQPEDPQTYVWPDNTIEAKGDK